MDCLAKIEYELQYPVDRHSRELLSLQTELILDYCMRFYERRQDAPPENSGNGTCTTCIENNRTT